MKDRVGTDRDAESLTKLCKFLGFATTRYNDLTGKSMKTNLEVNTFFFSSCFMVQKCNINLCFLYIENRNDGSLELRLLVCCCLESWSEWEIVFH